jgi:hypothetical protein
VSDSGQHFIDRSRALLTGSYLPRLDRCVDRLSEERVWWRANADSNSVGNLLLHLAGNVRQWIISGVGRTADVRQRQQEFAEQGPMPVAELMSRLKATVGEADRVLAGLTPAGLLERCTIQGRDVLVLDAIYTVVEHFSMHTGQIILLTKTWTGDLGFYDTSSGTPRPTFLEPRPTPPEKGADTR